MAPRAVSARKGFNRNHRFRGHGPLLQQPSPFSRSVAHPPPLQEGPMAPKAVSARKGFNRNHRFRGHGPLLQQPGPFSRSVAHPRPLIPSDPYNTAP